MSDKSQILSELRGNKRDAIVESLAKMLVRKRKMKRKEEELRKI